MNEDNPTVSFSLHKSREKATSAAKYCIFDLGLYVNGAVLM